MRLFNVDEDEQVASELKTFLREIFGNNCDDCQSWVDGKLFRQCSSLANSNGTFMKTKLLCAMKHYSLCEFWNLEYDEKQKEIAEL